MGEEALANSPVSEGMPQCFRPAHVGLLLCDEAIERGEQVRL